MRLFRALTACAFLAASGEFARAAENLLSNPGFEDNASAGGIPSHWTMAGGTRKAQITDKETHQGAKCLSIPPRSGIEQIIRQVEPGPYIARAWVKSEVAQPVTLLLQDPERPWAVYSCTEIQVPSNQWVQVEAFCSSDRKGNLQFTLGGTSDEFRFYHGVAGEMKAPILVDDCELCHYQPKTTPALAVWDSCKDLGATLDWAARDQWRAVEASAHKFAGTPVFQDGSVVGSVRKDNGGLMLYTVHEGVAKPRGLIEPSPSFSAGTCSLVHTNGRAGIQVASANGEHSYRAWLGPKGVISIEAANQVPQFIVRKCRLRYGLLPSFVGTDICYDPRKLPDAKQMNIPSTQWFVGLADGNDSMLVAAWEQDAQAVSLGFSGEGEHRMIDTIAIATDKSGFSLSFVEHPGIWRQEPLKEEWLGEYPTIGWQRPFPARWMGHFFVSPGGKPSFREPSMDYSFPIANSKTRLWGVWFEGWNHHPFFFDGPRTVLHFDKTFVPQGDALIYFLEPAAADFYSPCEIVEVALGKEKAAALFDFDGNGLRKLKYSTPNEFGYDRPVCATTTRLTRIKQEDRGTVGVNLVTHLYEFIRGIRGRVDEYTAFFEQMQSYLEAEGKAHSDLQAFVASLQALVAEAQAKSRDVYATPLTVVEERTESMKQLLLEGKGDGFDCGTLDVRSPAGAQDDLCRRYNRLVIRLTETAASNCGDSLEKSRIAKHVWDDARKILRQPTRWEPRRTLYFFEP